MTAQSCPCGSGRPLTACCGPCLAGSPAPTAEALMRSRYTAYCLGDTAYLLATWHPDTRPPTIDASGPIWTGLRILRTEAGGKGDREGRVEFVARYLDDGRTGELHEVSRFVRLDGAWRYVDGEVAVARTKVGRNDPCPCGSGRKFKRCCACRS